jgi:kynurenine formamidase
MAGTYLDLPTHIVETADGSDAANYPAARLYRVPAGVIHLDRQSGSGAISPAELAAAAPPLSGVKGLVVNALGARRFDAIRERSVWLTRDAVQWIVDRGVDLLVADVYESNSDPQDVFPLLFAARVATVCYPVELHRLDQPQAWITALPLRVPGATQIPCRVVAELNDAEGTPPHGMPCCR